MRGDAPKIHLCKLRRWKSAVERRFRAVSWGFANFDSSLDGAIRAGWSRACAVTRKAVLVAHALRSFVAPGIHAGHSRASGIDRIARTARSPRRLLPIGRHRPARLRPFGAPSSGAAGEAVGVASFEQHAPPAPQLVRSAWNVASGPVHSLGAATGVASPREFPVEGDVHSGEPERNSVYPNYNSLMLFGRKRQCAIHLAHVPF